MPFSSIVILRLSWISNAVRLLGSQFKTILTSLIAKIQPIQCCVALCPLQHSPAISR
ncbi:hypothetical protein AAHE18_20G021900 [Arachis hypogaea]